jgi:hypothetical protein
VVPETQNAKPSCCEIGIAVQISRRPSVLSTVRFHYKSPLKANKVDNPSSNGNLAAKFYECKLSGTQQSPKFLLSVRG